MSVRTIVHASELLTGAGIRRKDGRRVAEDDLGRVEDGAIAYQTRRAGKKEIPSEILWAGATSDLPKQYRRARRTDLKGKRAIVPGFVDCHTHMVFAGSRAEEFALRSAGATYEQIAARGGGILTTVQATRDASESELEKLAAARVKESVSNGVRTLEIKSGYGLSVESELKSLRVIQRLKKRFPEVTFQATFLGAHAFPKDRSREEYLRDVIEGMLPIIARDRLADACDVFVDRGYYTPAEGREILKKAKSLGLKVKLHADELANTESALLATELKALSADHLLKISDRGIAALGSSDTVAVLLPGTAFYLKEAYAPARRLIEAGAAVAISTDFNPGSCMCNNLPAIMTLSALYLGMSRAEILAAVTYNAAKALGMHSAKGTIEKGMDADFSILPFERFEDVYYRFAWTPTQAR